MSAAAPAAAPAKARPAPSGFQVKSLAVFALPLYFVILMAATIVTAIHHPAPHDLALTIAGPSSSTSRLAAGIDRQSPGSFDITQTADPAAARTAVLRRQAVGAVVLGGTASAPTVTTYVASAAGRSTVSAVQGVGTALAAQLKATPRTVDLAPVVADDTLATVVFYLVVYSGIGGYLTMIVLTQVMPRARLRLKYGVSAGAAVVAPLLVFGLTSIFVDFGLSFWQTMAVLGTDALYVFTVALVVVMAEQLIGRAAMFLVAPIAVFVNISSSGGPASESMLPGFWQALHSVWFGSGANEAIRDVVYFPGANPLRWIVQLLVWTVALLVITTMIEGAKLIWRLQSIVLRQQHQADSLQEHLQLMSVGKQSGPARQAIAGSTAGEQEPEPHERTAEPRSPLADAADRQPSRDDEHAEPAGAVPTAG